LGGAIAKGFSPQKVKVGILGRTAETVEQRVNEIKKKGSIINISSMAAQSPITRVVGYAAAKAAVDNFTKWLSVEMALKYGEGIRVNAIAPDFFIGEQNRNLLLNEDGSLTQRGTTIVSQTPMKRFGKAEELRGVALWLAGDSSSLVTGIIVPVDGGFSAFRGV
jgi:NAD(P)-dependent dehydrogenase (short-subunit alcohol dehydrogenase family)